jgi:hypothetical protein
LRPTANGNASDCHNSGIMASLLETADVALTTATTTTLDSRSALSQIVAAAATLRQQNVYAKIRVPTNDNLPSGNVAALFELFPSAAGTVAHQNVGQACLDPAPTTTTTTSAATFDPLPLGNVEALLLLLRVKAYPPCPKFVALLQVWGWML